MLSLANNVKNGEIIEITDDMSIYFADCAQHGDIFISSKFVIDIKQKLNKNICKYLIRLTGPNISIKSSKFDYLDMDILNYDLNKEYHSTIPSFVSITDDTKIIIIDTWIGYVFSVLDTNDFIYATYLPFYYEAFTKLYKSLNITIEPIEYYIPSFIIKDSITHNKSILNIHEIYNNISVKKILICNGSSYSSYNPIVDEIILRVIIPIFINSGFFVAVTNIDKITDPHILELYKNNIVKYIDKTSTNYNLFTNNTQLYENEIIASKSDYVFGQSSGLFYMTMTPNTTNTQFILLSHDKYLVYDKFKIERIQSYDVDIIINQLQSILLK
jgi:hypothetical protein